MKEHEKISDAHAAIQEAVLEMGDKFMVAVWSVKNDRLSLKSISWKFPKGDHPEAVIQMVETILVDRGTLVPVTSGPLPEAVGLCILDLENSGEQDVKGDLEMDVRTDNQTDEPIEDGSAKSSERAAKDCCQSGIKAGCTEKVGEEAFETDTR